jgi:tetratricopeptide (TPR) repeat protein
MDDGLAREVEEARLVLDARQELYGESDPTTCDAMLLLGRALRDAGDLRQAERVLTSALSLLHRAPETDEARVRWAEFNLAIVLDRLGEHEAARRLWDSVLASSDRDNGVDSELSRQTATNLAITLRKLRRYGDEFPLRVRVLESSRRSLGPDDAETIRAEIDLAQTHRHLGNHDLALALFAEAVAGLERTRGDQRTILLQKWAMATELVALKRSKEASVLFDGVVAGATEHLEPDDPFRRSALRQRRGYWLLGKVSRRGRKARGEDEPGTGLLKPLDEL